MIPTMQGLVEYAMYIYQGDMLMYRGDYEYRGWSVPGDWSTIVVIRPRGALEYPQKKTSASI